MQLYVIKYLTFLYKLGSLNRLLDLHLIGEVLLTGESLVKTSLEVVVSLRILTPKKE